MNAETLQPGLAEQRLAIQAALDFSDLAVRPEWCDPAGFLRTSFVSVIVDLAMQRVAREAWQVGWDHTETTGQSGFVVGCKVTCLRRLRARDPVRFEFIVADVDDKRNHVLTFLHHGTEGWLAATQEQLNVCVDFTTRRTAVWHPSSGPVLDAFRAAQRNWPRPGHIGHPVGAVQVTDEV